MEIHMFSLGLFFEAVTPQGMEVTCSAPAGRKKCNACPWLSPYRVSKVSKAGAEPAE